ncbi:MAG: hypothetical protein ACOCP8_00870 [archaeon]
MVENKLIKIFLWLCVSIFPIISYVAYLDGDYAGCIGFILIDLFAISILKDYQ